MEWISVEDRPPDNGEQVIVLIRTPHVNTEHEYVTQLALYGDGKFRGSQPYCYFESVQAWMPLPEPPQ